jgi:acetylornithine deacetylase/succinyl-diaminopimelate desuccinylase-like protein
VAYTGSRGHAPNEHIRIDDFAVVTRCPVALLENQA